MPLYLVRHGETALNKNHKLRGWADPELDDHGKSAARDAAAEISKEIPNDGKGRYVVSSDLKRAAETGRIIASKIGAIHSTSKALRPWNIGELSGENADTGEEKLKALKASGKAPKGGETYSDFARRWDEGHEALKEFAKDSHVVGVTHFRNIIHATHKHIQPGKFVKVRS